MSEHLMQAMLKLIKACIENNDGVKRLPSERKLAEQLSASRHSVREVLKQLVQKKIIYSLHGSGSYIIATDTRLLDQIFYTEIEKQKESLAELFDFRLILEPQIAKMAAANATETDIHLMSSILEMQENNIDSVALATRLDEEFHRLLAVTTKSEIAVGIMEHINKLISDDRLFDNRQVRIDSCAAHQEILAAIKQGEPEEASQKMQQHIEYVKQLLY